MAQNNHSKNYHRQCIYLLCLCLLSCEMCHTPRTLQIWNLNLLNLIKSQESNIIKMKIVMNAFGKFGRQQRKKGLNNTGYG